MAGVGGWGQHHATTGFLCVALTAPELCKPGWPRTQKYVPASASEVLRLKMWVTMLGKSHIFFVLENIFSLISPQG